MNGASVVTELSSDGGTAATKRGEWTMHGAGRTGVKPPGMTRRRVCGAAIGAAGLAGLWTAACVPGGATSGQSRALDKTQRDDLTWLIIYGDYSPRKDAYDAMQR